MNNAVQILNFFFKKNDRTHDLLLLCTQRYLQGLLKTKRPVESWCWYLIVVVALTIIIFHRIINAIWIITTNTLLPTYLPSLHSNIITSSTTITTTIYM